MSDISYPAVIVTSFNESARVIVRSEPSGAIDNSLIIPNALLPEAIQMLQKHLERFEESQRKGKRRHFQRRQGKQARREQLMTLLRNPQSNPEKIDYAYITCLFDELSPFIRQSYAQSGRGVVIIDFTRLDIHTVDQEALFNGHAVPTDYYPISQVDQFKFNILSKVLQDYDPYREFIGIMIHHNGPKIHRFSLL